MRGHKKRANAEVEHIYSAAIHWQELNGIGRSDFKGKFQGKKQGGHVHRLNSIIVAKGKNIFGLGGTSSLSHWTKKYLTNYFFIKVILKI